MTTKQMECILELSRMKNFNRAAENLFISQPALTYQIKTVEEEIGFRIFERSGRGVTMTLAGEQFSIVIRNVLEMLEEGIQQGQTHDSSFSNGVTIGLPYRTALYYLPEMVNRFRKQYPTVPITPHFSEAKIFQPREKLEWDIEFSVKENARRMSGIREYPLFKSGIYCIVPKDDPNVGRDVIRGEDLKEYKLIATNTKYPTIVHFKTRELLQTFHNTYYLTEDMPTVLHAVASHVGAALVPGFMNDHSGEFAWIPYDCEEKVECVLLTTSSEKRKSVTDVIGMLTDVYREHEGEPL